MALRIAAFLILLHGALSTALFAMSYPELIEKMRGFQESRILLTAVELDVFTAVGQGATAGAVAQKINTHERATEMLLNALVAIGALKKSDGVFHNTPETSTYLVAGSPDYARPSLMHIVNMFNSWATLTGSVRKGTAVVPPGVDRQEQEWTESFIAAMHSVAEGTAANLVRSVGTDGVRRLLDVGGGSGAYSIAFVKADPELRADLLDLASVVPLARKYTQEAGVADRISFKVGDLRTGELGKDYDLVLLSAICHMLSPEENRDLFRRSYSALAKGGRIVIRDFILEPDKTAPKRAALFAINMLVGTQAGSSYSEVEYRQWLTEAGFRDFRRPEPDGDLIVATR
ncbi:MAG: methyltransferase domain-containing protein [Bryobacteraceae bacterium]|nr:acetylserotonin O-methyltransferase [Bryobacterales bacterium]MEB2360573.1 methyltransferase [Bryobacterales bacterium]NUM99694.1 methyltransferase domain-containing protein [Bryobacteraceae bacterium]